MIEYKDVAGLAGYYLEDSWVRALHISGSEVAVDIDLVLTEAHADYTTPKPNEYYCFRVGRLSFPNPTSIEWARGRRFVPATDANGETDLGNIDSMYFQDGTWHLEGNWGTLQIRSENPAVTLEPIE